MRSFGYAAQSKSAPLAPFTFDRREPGPGGRGGGDRLPHEPHWDTAMESNEQLVYEMIRWFDMYVKNAPPR